MLPFIYEGNLETSSGAFPGRVEFRMKGRQGARTLAQRSFNGGYQQMDKQKLHRELEQLHAELQQVNSPDSNDREILQKLAGDIQKILEQKEREGHHYGSLSEALREAIAQLEASHPRVTILMRQVIDQLAYMGI
jgi:uncharacterized protein YicC (UPF0701 family)